MSVAVCPSCGETIKLVENARIGQRVTCHFCGEALEVVDVNPVELDWAYYEDEDWDDDDYEDDWDD